MGSSISTPLSPFTDLSSGFDVFFKNFPPEFLQLLAVIGVRLVFYFLTLEDLSNDPKSVLILPAFFNLLICLTTLLFFVGGFPISFVTF